MHVIEDIVKLLILSISQGYYFTAMLMVRNANGISKNRTLGTLIRQEIIGKEK